MKLSQSCYINAVLKQFGVQDSKSARTPVEADLLLEKSLEAQHLDKPYLNSSAVSLLVSLTW